MNTISKRLPLRMVFEAGKVAALAVQSGCTEAHLTTKSGGNEHKSYEVRVW